MEEEIKIRSTSIHPTNLWAGDNDSILLSLIYLNEQHDNVCIHIPISDHKERYRTYEIQWKCQGLIDKQEKFNIERSKLGSRFKPFYDKLTDLEIPEFFDNLLTKCAKRFIIIPIGLMCTDGSHSNLLVIDNKLMIAERFEPHGAETDIYTDWQIDKFDEKISSLLKKYKIKYLSAIDVCPKSGFQALEKNEKIVIGDPGGFCAAWSLFYLDSRLSNPDIAPIKLMEMIIKKFNMMGTNFTDFIRNYSSELLVKGLEISTKLSSENKSLLIYDYLVKSVENKIKKRRYPIKVIGHIFIGTRYVDSLLYQKTEDNDDMKIKNISDLTETIEKDVLDILSEGKTSMVFYHGDAIDDGEDLFKDIKCIRYWLRITKDDLYVIIVGRIIRDSDLATELMINRRLLRKYLKSITVKDPKEKYIKRMVKFIKEMTEGMEKKDEPVEEKIIVENLHRYIKSSEEGKYENLWDFFFGEYKKELVLISEEEIEKLGYIIIDNIKEIFK